MAATAVGIEGTFGGVKDKPLWELSDAHSTKLRNWNLRTAALSLVSEVTRVLQIMQHRDLHACVISAIQCGHRCVLTSALQSFT